MYSTVSRRPANPPVVPPKKTPEDMLKSSIRQDPLRNKADFLVRKLNAQACDKLRLVVSLLDKKQHGCDVVSFWWLAQDHNLILFVAVCWRAAQNAGW